MRRGTAAVLGAAVMAQMSVSVLQQGLPVLGPAFQSAFNLQTGGVGLLLGIGSIGTALTVWGWGRLTDRVTDRLVALLGLFLTSLFVTVAALALLRQSLLGVLIGLFCAGLCAAAPNVALAKSIAGAFQHGNHIGFAFGMRQAAAPMGAVLAGLTLPTVTLIWGLPAALLTQAVILAIAGLIVRAAVVSAPRRKETETSHRRALRAIAPTLAASGLYTATQIGVVSLLTIYLVNARDWRAGPAAALFTAVMVAAIVLRILVGMAGDAWPNRRKAMFTAIGVATAALLMTAALINPHPATVPLIVMAGITSMGWNPTAFTLTVTLVPHEYIGTSQGALNVLIFTAWGISPIVTGLLVQVFTWSVAWIVLALCGIVGAAIASRQIVRTPQ